MVKAKKTNCVISIPLEKGQTCLRLALRFGPQLGPDAKQHLVQRYRLDTKKAKDIIFPTKSSADAKQYTLYMYLFSCLI